MLWCSIQYIVCFTNIAIVSAFVVKTLCLTNRQNSLDTKIKVLILLPFFTTLFTAAVAVYHLIKEAGQQECIYFGSWIAMFAIDFEN